MCNDDWCPGPQAYDKVIDLLQFIIDAAENEDNRFPKEKVIEMCKKVLETL